MTSPTALYTATPLSDDDPQLGSDLFINDSDEFMVGVPGADQEPHLILSSTRLESSPPTSKPDTPRQSNELNLAEKTSGLIMCVVCHDKPAYSAGSNVHPTCGYKCASKLQAATCLPSSDYARISGPSTLMPSHNTRSLPDRLRMCDVCHIRPRYQRGGRIYPTCGLTCAAKMHAPGSVYMCDYCKKKPKLVINGRTYPQCGKTCHDKAKLAETAANAAACTSCILCWKSTKAGQSDFCSRACQSLADARAPFLIEIPRGHVSFKQECFASGWQRSNTHCPAIKRVYTVVMKSGFNTSHGKYRTKISSTGFLQKRAANEAQRWLVISRECNFGDPGDVEPCSSNRCLLCCILRSSVTPFDFPEGITTSTLNRAVECSRSGKRSSSKIAVLLDVLVGREAQMTPEEVQIVRPMPPLCYDSVHIIGIRNDGSKVDKGDIVVYDGDAVKPLYVISYE